MGRAAIGSRAWWSAGSTRTAALSDRNAGLARTEDRPDRDRGDKRSGCRGAAHGELTASRTEMGPRRCGPSCRGAQAGRRSRLSTRTHHGRDHSADHVGEPGSQAGPAGARRGGRSRRSFNSSAGGFGLRPGTQNCRDELSEKDRKQGAAEDSEERREGLLQRPPHRRRASPVGLDSRSKDARAAGGWPEPKDPRSSSVVRSRLSASGPDLPRPTIKPESETP
jgi:hypothetical protein